MESQLPNHMALNYETPSSPVRDHSCREWGHSSGRWYGVVQSLLMAWAVMEDPNSRCSALIPDSALAWGSWESIDVDPVADANVAITVDVVEEEMMLSRWRCPKFEAGGKHRRHLPPQPPPQWQPKTLNRQEHPGQYHWQEQSSFSVEWEER